MFDKLQQIGKLQEIQKQVKEQKVTVEKEGVVVTMNGSFEVEELKLNPEKDVASQEQIVKDALNEAVQKIQSSMMKTLSGLM